MNKIDKINVFFIIAVIWAMLSITVVLILGCVSMLSTNNRYDVNNDGIVNAQDYVAIKNYIMEGK